MMRQLLQARARPPGSPYLLAGLVLSLSVARAGTLDEWVVAALAKNPELAAAKQKWEAAKQKIPQVRALDDPMIGVDIERDSTRFNSYMDAEWMISQKLPWFGKRAAKASVAQLEAEATGFQYLELARALRGRVVAAHWQLWLAQQTVALTSENRQLLEEFAAAARARYEAGQTTQADLLRAEMELARVSNEVTTAARELQVAQAALNQLLAAAPTTPREVSVAPSLPALSASLEQLQSQARKYCCILMSSLRAAQAREAAVRVARLENAPDFELRVEARQRNGRSGIQEYDTGVAINFPWLWRGKYRALQQEARAEWAMAQADFENEVNATMLEIQELYTRVESAHRLVRLYETKLLPQARQLIETTRAHYEAGTARFPELVEAQKLWRDARLEHERARAEAGQAHARLETIAAPWGAFELATGLIPEDMQ